MAGLPASTSLQMCATLSSKCGAGGSSTGLHDAGQANTPSTKLYPQPQEKHFYLDPLESRQSLKQTVRLRDIFVQASKATLRSL